MASDEKRFTYDHMYAAVCIMEELVDPVSDSTKPWQAYRDAHGVSELRDVVIEHLADAADKAWDQAQKLHTAAYDEWIAECERVKQVGGDIPECPVEPGSFDYEFIPFWLRACIDWSDTQLGPRVLTRTTVP